MTWLKEAISDGEIDALQRAALAACNDDTQYPIWRSSHRSGAGECYNISRWLVSRLGGYIGSHKGHYAWLSPDHSYYLDLTNDHRDSHTDGDNRWSYLPNTSYLAIETLDNERTERFTKRANRIFDSLDRLLRLALDLGGDSHPAEEPQREDDRERFNDSWVDPDHYWHDEPNAQTPEGIYNFVFANGQLEVSPNHSHDELAGHAGIVPAQHTGPFATGHVVVTNGRATWEVHSNVNLHSFFRILKDASKQYGWNWGGMTNAEGQPVSELFAPKSSASILHYVFSGRHLLLGRTSAADLVASSDHDMGDTAVQGTISVLGKRALVSNVHVDALPSLFEFADDRGLTLYAANDNVIKTIPDLQEGNNYDPQGDWNPTEPSQPDERLPTGLYRCPACSALFPNWHEYSKHRRDKESWGDADRSNNGDRGLPEPDHGLYGDGAHYHEMRQEPGITTGKVAILPARSWKEAARVDGFAKYAKAFKYDNDEYLFYVAYRNGDPLGYAAVKPDGYIHMVHSAVENIGVGSAIYNKLIKHFDSLYTGASHEKSAALLKSRGWVQAKGQLWRWAKDKSPKDLIDAPMPFIYDVQDDKIFVGHPGTRSSEIEGRFTPAGIVEGTYEPGGKVIVRSMTSIPYTIHHLLELWYFSQPTLEVKSVHLRDDAGKDTRLASSDVGATVKTYVAMNPAVQIASNSLMMAGGEVIAVGGAVRDAVMGNEPHDIDLMVTGLPPEKVSHILQSLPGKVIHEGKAFGVFHYHYKGNEVHIALPRREHSTGAGHKDFDSQSDHTMKPEDDFYRRDFTANAMGVNLRNGQLIDPFGGAADIASGTLRTLNDRSFADDPLRVVRALVAHGRHGLNPDESTRTQMSQHAGGLRHLPPERIQAELDKLMESDNPARAIRLAHETGVLKHILPEVDAAFGYNQNNPHHEQELGDHLLNVLDRISQETKDPDLRLSALLHDIGKPKSAWKDPETGSNHYYEHHVVDGEGKRTGEILGADHEILGSNLARARMEALRYPKDRINRVSELVSHHMYPGFTTEAGARRFLNRVGDHADDLFKLRAADGGSKEEHPEAAWDPERNKSLVERVRAAGDAFTRKDLVLKGNELVGNLPQGPVRAQALNYLTDKVIEDPSLNNPTDLHRMVGEYAKLQGDEYEEPIQEIGQEEPQGETQSQGVRLGLAQEFAEGNEEAQVEPEFPNLQEAQEIHDQSIVDHGQPYAPLLNPGGLESALGRPTNHYYYGEGSHQERLADAAGALAHGIGMSQAFEDGNKRTAYHTTRYFLHNNDLGHVSPVEHDDEELADHLIGHGEGTHSLEDTQQLFRSRL